jgi:hypothetical protein
MRRKLPVLLVPILVGFAAPLHAQVPDWVTQILAAAQLPVVTAEVRQQGVSNAEIISVLDAMRNAGISAQDAASVLDAERVARRDNGPVDNFGAFVQSQLAAGKRGTDLAAAIHAEHARQGKGKGRGSAEGRGNASEGRGASAGRGASEGRGASDGRGAKPGRGGAVTGKPPAKPSEPDKKDGNRGRGRPPNA